MTTTKETPSKRHWVEYNPKNQQSKYEKSYEKPQFKEYIPKHKLINQKPKISYTSKKYDSSKEITEEIEEEDEYSGLAGTTNYKKKIQKPPEWKNHKNSSDNYFYDFKTKWKTEICHYWEMYGKCKFGDSCAFAHGESELKERKLTFNYKTKLCKQFFESGYCSYGSRCQFSHKNESSKNNKISDVSYLKILSEFMNQNEKITYELVKRPRLIIFENIFSCSLEEAEKSKMELYKDIQDIKQNLNKNDENDNENNIKEKMEKEEKQFKLSENTNCSNNNDINDINNNDNNESNNNDN